MGTTFAGGEGIDVAITHERMRVGQVWENLFGQNIGGECIIFHRNIRKTYPWKRKGLHLKIDVENLSVLALAGFNALVFWVQMVVERRLVVFLVVAILLSTCWKETIPYTPRNRCGYSQI